MQKYNKTMAEILREMNEATVSVFDISYDDVPKSKLTQAAKKFGIRMKKLPKNKVSFGGDDAIEFSGSDSNLLKFAKQQFGTTARNIKDLKKELEEQEDPVQKAQDKLDKADLKKQIDTVRQEGQAYDNDRFLVRGNTAKVDNKNTKDTKDHVYAPNAKTAVAMKKKGVKQFLDTNKMRKMFPTYSEAVDSDDTGGAAEVDMIMNQVNQMRHFLDGIERMVSDDGDVEEWVQGKITKATDYLKTAYSYKTGEKNEALDKNDMLITEFTSAQIKRLKKEYEPLRGVHHTELQPARFTQLSKMMQRMGKPQLQALVKADIPVLSSAAKASLVVNHGMKFSSIKEELIPYLEIFPLDENRKSKFKEVDPKVIDRIEKMMRGSREEKDSIANMLNYMMPPEVVDIVRYKLKIVPKRGKIKF